MCSENIPQTMWERNAISFHCDQRSRVGEQRKSSGYWTQNCQPGSDMGTLSASEMREDQREQRERPEITESATTVFVVWSQQAGSVDNKSVTGTRSLAGSTFTFLCSSPGLQLSARSKITFSWHTIRGAGLRPLLYKCPDRGSQGQLQHTQCSSAAQNSWGPIMFSESLVLTLFITRCFPGPDDVMVAICRQDKNIPSPTYILETSCHAKHLVNLLAAKLQVPSLALSSALCLIPLEV